MTRSAAVPIRSLCTIVKLMSALLIAVVIALTVPLYGSTAREVDDFNQVSIFNRAGQRRITLTTTVQESEATIGLINAHGSPEMIFSLHTDGAKKIVMSSDDGKKSSIGIILDKNGSAMIGLEGAGRSALFLASEQDGGTYLQFYDKKKRVRIKLGLGPNGAPGLDFFDEAGKSVPIGPSPQAPVRPAP